MRQCWTKEAMASKYCDKYWGNADATLALRGIACDADGERFGVRPSVLTLSGFKNKVSKKVILIIIT